MGIEGISKGNKFLCFKTVSMANQPKRIIFKVGKVYNSYNDGYIEDECGNANHLFTHSFWTKYLIKLNDEYEELDTTPIKNIPLGDKILVTSALKKYQNK